MADTKIDSKTVEFTKTIPAVETKVRYGIEDLLKQKLAIIDQRKAEMARRDTELAEVNSLISRAKALCIEAKSLEDQVAEAESSL